MSERFPKMHPDAEALSDAVCKHLGSHDGNAQEDVDWMLSDALNGAEASVAADSWIPVAERMPPRDGKLVMFWAHQQAHVGHRSVAGWSVPDDGNPEGCDFDDGDVTHWAEIRRPT